MGVQRSRRREIVNRGPYPLAILTPHIGGLSETFIENHIRGILPGRTCVITAGSKGHWEADCPVLDLREVSGRPRRISEQLFWAAAWHFGRPQRNPVKVAFQEYLKESGVEVVLAEYLDFAAPYADWVSEAGVRFVVHGHGYDISARWVRDPELSSGYERHRRADAVVTVSESSRKRLISFGIPSDNVHVVPYGVALPKSLPERTERGETRCLAVGRMVSKKAPIFLLDAFRRAAERNPKVFLDYVGDGWLLPAAEQYVKAMGLEDSVVLHGACDHDQVKRMMAGADVFLQHSRTCPMTGDSEGLPVAILEAMAHGLPVVSTHHEGIPDAVADGVTGLLVEEGDVAGMAHHIHTLVQNRALRLRMGAEGLSRARREYRNDLECSRLREILGL